MFARVLIALSLSLTHAGCATCERHLVACAAAVGIVGTSIALSLRHHHSDVGDPPARMSIPSVPCVSNPELCQ